MIVVVYVTCRTAAKMQLSTNRVNFTSASISQLNYAKFLCKSGSTQKGIEDIVTILGLHRDNFSREKRLNVVSRRLRSTARRLRNKGALVPFVPPKNVKFNFEKPVSWYIVVVFALYNENCEIQLMCDLRTGVLKMCFRERRADYTICLHIVNFTRNHARSCTKINMVQSKYLYSVSLLSWYHCESSIISTKCESDSRNRHTHGTLCTSVPFLR